MKLDSHLFHRNFVSCSLSEFVNFLLHSTKYLNDVEDLADEIQKVSSDNFVYRYSRWFLVDFVAMAII